MTLWITDPMHGNGPTMPTGYKTRRFGTRWARSRDIVRYVLGTSLTVGDIVAAEAIGATAIAGHAGLAQHVLWAHACEMHDPVEWLGPGELLMTIGLCVPASPSEQAAFIDQLADAGLVGMMVGDHPTLPGITELMRERAEARAFPILLVPAATPFAAVARLVAAANSAQQTMQVLRLAKLYQVASSVGEDPVSLIAALERVLGTALRVEDRETGLVLLGAKPETEAEAGERRMTLDGEPPLDLVLATPDARLDAFSLVHVRLIVQVAASRYNDAVESRAARGSAALAEAMSGGTRADLDALLDGYRLAAGYRVVALPVSSWSSARRAVALSRLPALTMAGVKSGMILVPEAVVPELRKLLRMLSVAAGASSVFLATGDMHVALLEAQQCLEWAHPGGEFWAEFKGVHVSLLTRSIREAEEVVTRVLEPIAGDDARSTLMRETLFAYLENDRRWEPTATALSIHRQTLAYRLNRLHELTGLDLSTTAGVSAGWIAMHAWRQLRG